MLISKDKAPHSLDLFLGVAMALLAEPRDCGSQPHPRVQRQRLWKELTQPILSRSHANSSVQSCTRKAKSSHFAGDICGRYADIFARMLFKLLLPVILLAYCLRRPAYIWHAMSRTIFSSFLLCHFWAEMSLPLPEAASVPQWETVWSWGYRTLSADLMGKQDFRKISEDSKSSIGSVQTHARKRIWTSSRPVSLRPWRPSPFSLLLSDLVFSLANGVRWDFRGWSPGYRCEGLLRGAAAGRAAARCHCAGHWPKGFCQKPRILYVGLVSRTTSQTAWLLELSVVELPGQSTHRPKMVAWGGRCEMFSRQQSTANRHYQQAQLKLAAAHISAVRMQVFPNGHAAPWAWTGWWGISSASLNELPWTYHRRDEW